MEEEQKVVTDEPQGVETPEVTDVETQVETPEVPDETPEETTETPDETGETPEETPQEDGSVSQLKEFVLKFNPEADVSTTESLLSALVPLMGSLVAIHDDFSQIIDEFPELGEFLLGLKKGMTPNEAYMRYLYNEGDAPPEGAPDFDSYKSAQEERRAALSKRKEWEQKLPENLELTSKNMMAAATQLGLDETVANEAKDKFLKILEDAKDGMISQENWVMIMNGTRHESVVSQKDKEMEAAVEDAKIAGRNEQIEKKRMTKETGDGLPKLTNTGSAEPKAKDQFTTGLEQLANKKSVI